MKRLPQAAFGFCDCQQLAQVSPDHICCCFVLQQAASGEQHAMKRSRCGVVQHSGNPGASFASPTSPTITGQMLLGFAISRQPRGIFGRPRCLQQCCKSHTSSPLCSSAGRLPPACYLTTQACCRWRQQATLQHALGVSSSVFCSCAFSLVEDCCGRSHHVSS